MKMDFFAAALLMGMRCLGIRGKMNRIFLFQSVFDGNFEK
jgi:hypothetical protein